MDRGGVVVLIISGMYRQRTLTRSRRINKLGVEIEVLQRSTASTDDVAAVEKGLEGVLVLVVLTLVLA